VQVTRPHGTIRVQIMPEPGHVVVSVADEGPGLTDDERAAVTEPILATAAAAIRDEDVRADLGLAVAREFVRRMDGELWCDSEPGRGAVYSFRLPALE
jgi:signal transduction histidine kinase